MNDGLTKFPATMHDRLAICRSLMDQHGLDAWKLRLSNANTRLGSCAYHTQTIRLSRHLLQHNAWEQVRDTILHEIAHALVGPRHGHDAVWKAKASVLGATPRSCTRRGEVNMPAPGWIAWCPNCRLTAGRYHRRPRRWRSGYVHRPCGHRIEFQRASSPIEKFESPDRSCRTSS